MEEIPPLYFEFMERPILTYHLGYLKRWGPKTLLTYHGSLLKQQYLVELFFMSIDCLIKFPCFHILSDCGIGLPGMVCVSEGVSQFVIKLPVLKKKLFILL